MKHAAWKRTLLKINLTIEDIAVENQMFLRVQNFDIAQIESITEKNLATEFDRLSAASPAPTALVQYLWFFLEANMDEISGRTFSQTLKYYYSFANLAMVNIFLFFGHDETCDFDLDFRWRTLVFGGTTLLWP